MGLGKSKIDYKERNFTEQPLDDQEIDILLQALPEENIINSIESEGREKILKSMSDQKVFNIRGDNIFDYYFTNNKDELKGCMSNQFTRDGTPCPDEKFNRMITKIPDLVQGPLREKETEWDTEKTNLQSQYDTLNEERQQKLEALALDGFLANPEMYNKMLMEKMSQKSLDIFTKDGDIDINVKELVEHPSFKSTLERAHKEKRTHIPSFIQGFKSQASYLINQFKKEAADSVKSQMPPLAFLAPLIQMKVAAQYAGSDKTKIVPNRTLYNYFSEFFDELGIGSNNIEYTLKFITFNTFKKFMDYDSKNDVKGIDLHLKDFLKLIKEFGGEEYLNSLSNFDVDTDFQSLYNTLNTEKTELQLQYETLNTEKTNLQSQYDTLNTVNTEITKYRDKLIAQTNNLESEIQKNLLSNVVRVTDGDNIKTVSEQQCKAYAKSLRKPMEKGNDTSGCYLAPSGVGTSGVYYTKKTGKGKCYYNSDSDYRVCIQNNLNRNNTYSKKKCNGNVGGEYDCRVDGTWDQITVKGWDRNKYGQTLDAAKHFCNTHKDCVAVASSSADWNWPVHTTSKFKPCNTVYKEVTTGKPDLSVTSAEECMAYAESFGYSYNDYGGTGELDGCWINKIGPNVYYTPPGKSTSGKTCSDSSRACIQKEINCDPKVNYHNKRECKKPIDGVWSKGVGESCEWECPGRSGIEKYTVPKFKTTSSAYACSARDYLYDKEKEAHSGGSRKLVQGNKGHFSCRSQSGANFGWTSYKHQDNAMTYKSSCSDWDNPAMFYQKVGDDKELYKSVSEEECKAYADTHGHNYSLDNITNNNNDCQAWANGVECTANPNYMWGNCKKACYEKFNPKGCVIRNNDVWFNKKESDRKCGEQSINCIQGELKKEDFKTVSSGKPLSKYKDVSSGKNNRSVSESECKAYAQTIPGYGYSTVTNTDRPHGCYHSGKQYRYAANGTLDCGHGSDICIQKNPDYVSEQQCKAYAKLIGETFIQQNNENNLPGCYNPSNKNVIYNKNYNNNNNYDCSHNSCIQLK